MRSTEEIITISAIRSLLSVLQFEDISVQIVLLQDLLETIERLVERLEEERGQS